jgi:hypothetical protein
VQPEDDGLGPHTLKALLVIAVLVVIGIVVLAKSTTSGKSPVAGAPSSHHSTTTTVTGPPASTTTTTLVPASALKVQVLNGASPTKPLASQWSTKLHTQFGYDTLPGDNATSLVTSSVIYVVTPGYAGEATRLAGEVGLSSSAVVTGIPSTAPIPTRDRAAPNLILVVGPDLAQTA